MGENLIMTNVFLKYTLDTIIGTPTSEVYSHSYS